MADNPYWELPGGNLTIRFWVDSEAGVWNNNKTPMEGQISIDKFFLIPIEESGSGMDLPWLISPETGDGNRGTIDYYPQYATNLIKSDKDKGSFSFLAYISRSGYYKLWCSVFSSRDNNLNILIKGKSDKRNQNIKIKGRDTWSFAPSDLIYLNQGEYIIILKHFIPDKILIDYLMFLPDKDYKHTWYQ